MRRIIILLLALAACGKTYELLPIDVGADGPGRDPRPRSNTQYLRGLYADLVGRAPESYDFQVLGPDGSELGTFPIAEQDYLLFTLDGVGDPTPIRNLIAAGLVRSQEVDLPEKADVADAREWIREQFERFLGRDPNPYELEAFLAEWQADDAVNPRTVIRALVGSREYQSY